MLRNLTANLIAHERIETTDAKAKELRRVAERLITKAIRLGETAYLRIPAQKPSDPEKAKEQALKRAKRLAVERLIRRFIPRFATRIEGDDIKRIDLVEKVLVDLAKRFQGRPGGYTRIIKLGPRRGDNAPMSRIEFVGELDAVVEDATSASAEGSKAKKAKKA